MPILTLILIALVVVLYLAIATVLVRKYLRTRNVGFAWLGVAGVVWPLLSQPLQYGQRVLIDRVGSGPFATLGQLLLTLAYAREAVGLALLFIAVFFLSKTKQLTVRVA